MTRKTDAVMASAIAPSPPIARLFEIRSIRSLFFSRQRSRWYALGAIRRIVADQGREQGDHVRDLLGPVDVESRAERHDEQEREQDLGPGQRHAQLVQQLDQLLVALLPQLALVHVSTVARRCRGPARRFDRTDDGGRLAATGRPRSAARRGPGRHTEEELKMPKRSQRPERAGSPAAPARSSSQRSSRDPSAPRRQRRR